MAGLGRRSHYRKHLTDAVLYEFPEPSPGDCIAKVVATRGGNLFDVIVPRNEIENSEEHKRHLAILPTKFNKLVWVKRNDYVICRTGDEEDKNGGGVRFEIAHILYKDQVNHLKKKSLWPTNDDEFDTMQQEDTDLDQLREMVKQQRECNDDDGSSRSSREDNTGDSQEGDMDDGIVYNDTDDDYFVNTNRIKNMTLHDDSSSESSNDED